MPIRDTRVTGKKGVREEKGYTQAYDPDTWHNAEHRIRVDTHTPLEVPGFE